MTQFESFRDAATEQQTETTTRATVDSPQQRRQRLCCASCGQRITDEGEAISVYGGNDHWGENPMGQMFHFRCFRDAPGCNIIGLPTFEHSWFPGNAWQYAHCEHCQTQLGWLFIGDEAFFALIIKQLTPCAPSFD